MSASKLAAIKAELSKLKTLFGNHERFSVVDENHGESCVIKFKANDGNFVVIKGKIPESYPISSPVWFTEDEAYAELVLNINRFNDSDNRIMHQVGNIITNLCEALSCPLPKFIQELDKYQDKCATMKIDENSDEESDDCDDDSVVSFGDSFGEAGSEDPVENPFDPAQQKIRAKLDQCSKPDWSCQATNRIQKELMEIWRSEANKEIFDVELAEDSLYKWNIRLLQIDVESPLYQDLLKLKALGRSGEIQLEMNFGQNYPFEPPFIRVVEPVISYGHVFTGGSICMELLMNKGWSSAYTAESVILQVAATLVQGEGRVNFNELSTTTYSESVAREAFKLLQTMPDSELWTSLYNDS